MKILHRLGIVKIIPVQNFNHSLDRRNRCFQLMRRIGNEAFLHPFLFHRLRNILKHQQTSGKPAVLLNRHGQALEVDAVVAQIAHDRILAQIRFLQKQLHLAGDPLVAICEFILAFFAQKPAESFIV